MQEETFIDDETVPVETRICYSRNEAIIEIALSLFFSVVFLGMSIMFYEKKFFLFLLFLLLGTACIFAIHSSHENYKKSLNNVAKIIINNEGMQTFGTEFMPWCSISREKMIVEIEIVKIPAHLFQKKEEQEKYKKYYLVYEYHSQQVKFFLSDNTLADEYKELSHLLKIYRGRFEQQRNKENLQRS